MCSALLLQENLRVVSIQLVQTAEMIQPVVGVMMVLEQDWGSVYLVGMLAQTSQVSAVRQVDGFSQSAPVSNTYAVNYERCIVMGMMEFNVRLWWLFLAFIF